MAPRKLYYENPYLGAFNAKVMSISGREVVLDSTAFFPSGGGQVCDTGEIGGIRVIAVRRIGDNILHELERVPDLAVGQEVQCRIDWEKRYRTMRLHSAAHVVYYIMKEVFKTEPVSPGIVDDRKDRSDYLFEEAIEAGKLGLVTAKVNEVIAKSLPIDVWQEGDVRYWRTGEFPEMKCAGTHVRNTGEIGPVKVLRGKKPGRGRERIETSLLAP